MSIESEFLPAAAAGPASSIRQSGLLRTFCRTQRRQHGRLHRKRDTRASNTISCSRACHGTGEACSASEPGGPPAEV